MLNALRPPCLTANVRPLMTAEEIRAEIDRVCRRDWDTELAPLLEHLRQSDSTATFHSLFHFAAHSQDAGPAAPAALLLRRLNPPCPISCRQAVGEMLTDWDVSIEEVPFYLAEQFGVAQVRTTVAELRSSHAGKTESTLLDTIEYWLRCYDEMQEYRRQHGTA
jgi:hypothetical protein